MIPFHSWFIRESFFSRSVLAHRRLARLSLSFSFQLSSPPASLTMASCWSSTCNLHVFEAESSVISSVSAICSRSNYIKFLFSLYLSTGEARVKHIIYLFFAVHPHAFSVISNESFEKKNINVNSLGWNEKLRQRVMPTVTKHTLHAAEKKTRERKSSKSLLSTVYSTIITMGGDFEK